MPNIKLNQPITVDHVARIEGKAGIEVYTDDKNDVAVKVNIFEGPRFFESITLGKPVTEAVAIFPRVCSFCAAAHKITALQAAENALGVVPTKQVQRLRELLYVGDHIESHALHLFLLALPDFYGYPDAFSMAKEHPDTVRTAMDLKDLGAKIQNVIGSRYIHQENAIIGGFGTVDFEDNLLQLEKELPKLAKKATLAVKLFSKFKLWPEVASGRVHVAIKPESDGYGIQGANIHTSEGACFDIQEYRTHIKESVVSHSFAKHCTFKEKPFVTGALSRIIVNGDLLKGRSRNFLNKYASLISADNPLSNNMAQAIELVFFIDRAKELIQDILAEFNPAETPVAVDFSRTGSGVSVTEAPRGLVAYMLEIDKKGVVKKADIITPTAMFLPQMEKDLLTMTTALLKKGTAGTDQIRAKLETIVRSYDPCVSCSVHVTKTKNPISTR